MRQISQRLNMVFSAHLYTLKAAASDPSRHGPALVKSIQPKFCPLANSPKSKCQVTHKVIAGHGAELKNERSTAGFRFSGFSPH